MSNRTKQLLSIVLSFAVYSVFINWKIALLLVISIAFHEQSHLEAAKHLKLRTNLFYLIPFVGGVSLVNDRYKSYAQQAFVAVMGPVGGAFLAVVTTCAYFLTGWQILAPAAFYMSIMNLFNLAPLAMLDGGQLLDTISYSFNRTLGLVLHAVSTAIAVVLITWKLNMTVGILIGIYGIPQVITEFKNWQAFKAGTFYLCSQSYLFPPRKASSLEMIQIAGAWIAAITVLFLNMVVLASHGTNLSLLFSK
jgi:Zn-dependent protease